MTRLGPNLKITTHAAHRGRIREILQELLGLALTVRGDFDIFALGEGSIGYFFVEAPADALTPEEARKGAWLELLVDDPVATGDALVARGVESFVYQGTTRDYFVLPGGQVFRLARG